MSGVGGGVGQSIIKTLYETDYQIVGLDGEQLAAGLYAVPTSYLIPYSQQSNYLPELNRILALEECRLLFPGLDAELPTLSANRQSIEENSGCIVVVSRPEVIQIADDKLLTARFLAENGFPCLQTIMLQDLLDGGSRLEFPFIVKLKSGGARSRQVFKISNSRDLDRILPDIDPAKFVAQEFADGDEYTCGSVSFDGECFGVIAMNRILRNGDTYKCFVELKPDLQETLCELVSVLKPFGPLNIQLRMRDRVPYVFELNARCSGTTAARAISGFNEPKIVADFLLHGIRPEIQIKKTAILRYWNELLVDQDDIDSIQTQHVKKTLRNPHFWD